MKKFLISLLSFGFFAHIYAAEMKLVYWSHTHDPAVGVNEKIINDFMNENPNIEVVYDHVPHANYEQKIMTAFAGKEGPDLFWAGDWMVPQYIENKMIAPVDPSAFGVSSQTEFLDLFNPGSLDGFMVDGKVYTGGISEYNSFSLIYNKKHMDEIGVKLSKDTPVTWNRLADITSKLTKKTGSKITRIGFSWPYTSGIWNVLVLEPMLRQAGGELVDVSKGKAMLDTAPALRVMNYIKKLKDSDAIDPAFYSDLLGDLANERASMIIGGPWAVSPLKDMNPDLEWDTAPMAQFSDAKSRITTLYAWAWFVNANTTPEKQKAAWRLINKLTSNQQLWWDKVGYVQARKGNASNGQDMDSYMKSSDPRITTIFNDYPHGRYQFASPHYKEISDMWTRVVTRVLAGEDPKKVLKDAQNAADFILD